MQSFKTWCNTSRVGATCYRGSQDIQEIQVYVRTYVYEHSEFHVIGELAGSLKSIIIIHIKQPQIFVSKLKQGDNEQEAFEILLHSKNKKKSIRDSPVIKGNLQLLDFRRSLENIKNLDPQGNNTNRIQLYSANCGHLGKHTYVF